MVAITDYTLLPGPAPVEEDDPEAWRRRALEQIRRQQAEAAAVAAQQQQTPAYTDSGQPVSAPVAALPGPAPVEESQSGQMGTPEQQARYEGSLPWRSALQRATQGAEGLAGIPDAIGSAIHRIPGVGSSWEAFKPIPGLVAEGLRQSTEQELGQSALMGARTPEERAAEVERQRQTAQEALRPVEGTENASPWEQLKALGLRAYEDPRTRAMAEATREYLNPLYWLAGYGIGGALEDLGRLGTDMARTRALRGLVHTAERQDAIRANRPQLPAAGESGAVPNAIELRPNPTTGVYEQPQPSVLDRLKALAERAGIQGPGTVTETPPGFTSETLYTSTGLTPQQFTVMNQKAAAIGQTAEELKAMPPEEVARSLGIGIGMATRYQTALRLQGQEAQTPASTPQVEVPSEGVSTQGDSGTSSVDVLRPYALQNADQSGPPEPITIVKRGAVQGTVAMRGIEGGHVSVDTAPREYSVAFAAPEGQPGGNWFTFRPNLATRLGDAGWIAINAETGEQRVRGFNTRAEALQWAREHEAAKQAESPTAPSGGTIAAEGQNVASLPGPAPVEQPQGSIANQGVPNGETPAATPPVSVRGVQPAAGTAPEGQLAVSPAGPHPDVPASVTAGGQGEWPLVVDVGLGEVPAAPGLTVVQEGDVWALRHKGSNLVLSDFPTLESALEAGHAISGLVDWTTIKPRQLQSKDLQQQVKSIVDQAIYRATIPDTGLTTKYRGAPVTRPAPMPAPPPVAPSIAPPASTTSPTAPPAQPPQAPPAPPVQPPPASQPAPSAPGPVQGPAAFSQEVERMLVSLKDAGFNDDLLQRLQSDAARPAPLDPKGPFTFIRQLYTPSAATSPAIQMARVAASNYESAGRHYAQQVGLTMRTAITEAFPDAAKPEGMTGRAKAAMSGEAPGGIRSDVIPSLAAKYHGTPRNLEEQAVVGTLFHVFSRPEDYALTPLQRRTVEEWNLITNDDRLRTLRAGIDLGEWQGSYITHSVKPRPDGAMPRVPVQASQISAGRQGFTQHRDVNLPLFLKALSDAGLEPETDVITLMVNRLEGGVRLRAEFTYLESAVKAVGGHKLTGNMTPQRGFEELAWRGTRWAVPEKYRAKVEQELQPLVLTADTAAAAKIANELRAMNANFDVSTFGTHVFNAFYDKPLDTIVNYLRAVQVFSTPRGLISYMASEKNARQLLWWSQHGLVMHMTPEGIDRSLIQHGHLPIAERVPGIRATNAFQFDTLLPILKTAAANDAYQRLLLMKYGSNIPANMLPPGVTPDVWNRMMAVVTTISDPSSFKYLVRLKRPFSDLSEGELAHAAADYTNNLLGGLNQAEIGRRQPLRIFFSSFEDWNRARLNRIANAVKSAGPEGALARSYLLRRYLLITAFGIAGATAQGELITQDYFDPRSPKWGSIRMGKERVGIDSDLSTSRTLASMILDPVFGASKQAQHYGESAAEEVLNNISSWMTARGSAWLTLGYGAATGKESPFSSEKISEEDKLSAKKVWDWGAWIARTLASPITLQALWQDLRAGDTAGKTARDVGVSALGVNIRPTTFFEESDPEVQKLLMGLQQEAGVREGMPQPPQRLSRTVQEAIAADEQARAKMSRAERTEWVKQRDLRLKEILGGIQESEGWKQATPEARQKFLAEAVRRADGEALRMVRAKSAAGMIEDSTLNKGLPAPNAEYEKLNLEMEQLNRRFTNARGELVNPKQWREERSALLRQLARREVTALGIDLPQNFGYEGQASFALRLLEAARKTQDERERGRLLLAAYSAWPVYERAPGERDLSDMERSRDRFIGALSSQDQTLLQQQMQKRMTPLELQFEQDRRQLRDYFAITDQVAQQPRYQKMVDSLDNGTEAERQTIRKSQVYKDYQRDLREKKLRWRQSHPQQEKLLEKWEYVTASAAGRSAY